MAKRKTSKKTADLSFFSRSFVAGCQLLFNRLITGWQLTKQPQPQIYKTEPAQLASNLTSNEHACQQN